VNFISHWLRRWRVSLVTRQLREKRRRAAALQDAAASSCDQRFARSVPECAQPSGAFADRRPITRNFSFAHAFTLIEVLVVAAIIGLLAALLLPTLVHTKLTAQRADCVCNLRELGLGTELYLGDNAGFAFRKNAPAIAAGQQWWFGWLGSGAEGQRAFDLTTGVLFPYLHGTGTRLCPSFDYTSPLFKLKGTNVIFSYGCNSYFFAGPNQTPVAASSLRHPADTVFFADAAEVNNFQAPASASHPMFEEFYYVDTNTAYPNGHFRHDQMANVIVADGHADLEKPVPGSLDPRVPSQFIGRLRPEILTVP